MHWATRWRHSALSSPVLRLHPRWCPCPSNLVWWCPSNFSLGVSAFSCSPAVTLQTPEYVVRLHSVRWLPVRKMTAGVLSQECTRMQDLCIRNIRIVPAVAIDPALTPLPSRVQCWCPTLLLGIGYGAVYWEGIFRNSEYWIKLWSHESWYVALIYFLLGHPQYFPNLSQQ